MVDPDDIDLDQSMRVQDRVANGAYRITRGKHVVGEELWQVLRLRSGILRVMTEISMAWPVEHHHRVRYDVAEGWQIEALWIEVESQGTRFTGTFTPDEGETLRARVTSATIHRDESAKSKADQEAQPQTFRAAPSKLVRDERLPFPAGAQIDFNSPMFNYVILKRLGLDRSAAWQTTFNAIVITLPQLEPVLVKETYAWLDQQPPKDNRYTFPLWRYRITETGNPDAVTDFWTNERGIVAQQHVTLNGVPVDTAMTSYRWHG